MTDLSDRPVSVVHEQLVDIDQDGTQILFLRHFVHSGKDGRILRHYDTDISGIPYTRVGIQTRPASYDVYAGIVCMTDPENDTEYRVKQFFSTNGIISYTTISGVPIMETPVGAVFRECEA